jgi:hypothetical protein
MINEPNVTCGADHGPNAEQAKILWNYCHTLTNTYGSAVQVVRDSHLLHTTAYRLQVRKPNMRGQAFGVPFTCLYSRAA